MRTICLVDGEHYLPVNRDAIDELTSRGHQVVAAVFLGGTEKIGDPQDVVEGLGVPVLMDPTVSKGQVPFHLIEAAVAEHSPDMVMDLSDEPIVDYHARFLMASLLLRLGVVYMGADFRFDPPDQHLVLRKPSLAVIGTAKRVGKTAISGYISRAMHAGGLDPVIVTMGRGGPPEPEVIHGGELELTPAYLLEQAELGKHAASDHWEDALTSRVTTVGCRRCGGGMAGQAFVSNVLRGAEVANDLSESFVIMEGSGATLPPVHTDARMVLVLASQPLNYIESLFGPYRVGISDMAVVAMCEPPMADQAKVEAVNGALRRTNPDITIADVVFRPRPMADVSGKRVVLAMTAPDRVMEDRLVPHLEVEAGCLVEGWSSDLSNRPRLREALREGARRADTLLVEVKAAAIDVATRYALSEGLEVVYMDNEPVVVGGDVDDLAKACIDLARTAMDRFGGV